MMQMTLEFRPGLTQEFKTLRAVTHAAVMRTRGAVAGIAPDVDMSPSLLGRKLNGSPEDPHRTLDIDDFDKVLERLAKEGDMSPLYWLIEKYLPSDEQRHAANLNQLAALLPQITALLEGVRGSGPGKGGRK